jgi:CCR4-NOT complex subunit CAF16
MSTAMSAPAPVIEVRGLDFRYPAASGLALHDVRFSLERGVRCLLLGRNGAGKTTLLHVLAGKHMVPEEKVRVLGRPAFHDTSLAAEVTFLGGRFQFDVDVVVGDILRRTPGVDPQRRDRLIAVLGVDPGWHMHRISDGQRRRVQMLLGLLHPAKVLLLDEITTDLDLIGRMELLELLREESQRRGATILYATHILDAMEGWASHVAWMEAGRLMKLCPISDLISDGEGPLYQVAWRWMKSAPFSP